MTELCCTDVTIAILWTSSRCYWERWRGLLSGLTYSRPRPALPMLHMGTGGPAPVPPPIHQLQAPGEHQKCRGLADATKLKAATKKRGSEFPTLSQFKAAAVKLAYFQVRSPQRPRQFGWSVLSISAMVAKKPSIRTVCKTDAGLPCRRLGMPREFLLHCLYLSFF